MKRIGINRGNYTVAAWAWNFVYGVTEVIDGLIMVLSLGLVDSAFAMWAEDKYLCAVSRYFSGYSGPKEQPMANDSEDVFLWPDGSWLFREQYGEDTGGFSDDYEVIRHGTDRWQEFMVVECPEEN